MTLDTDLIAWRSLGHYLKLAPANEGDSVIPFLVSALQQARKIPLSARQSRFGAYLEDYPANLAPIVFSALEHAFPHDVSSAPVWLEYDFGDWTTPSNLLPDGGSDSDPDRKELYGRKSTENLLFGSRIGHLLFRIKGDEPKIGSFSCFTNTSETDDGELPSPSFTPVIVVIDLASIERLQRDMTTDEAMHDPAGTFSGLMKGIGVKTGRSVITSTFRERVVIKSLQEMLPDTAKDSSSMQESMRAIYMNAAARSALSALSALAISQCHIPFWAKMPGRIKVANPLKYALFHTAFSWQSDRNGLNK